MMHVDNEARQPAQEGQEREQHDGSDYLCPVVRVTMATTLLACFIAEQNLPYEGNDS